MSAQNSRHLRYVLYLDHLGSKILKCSFKAGIRYTTCTLPGFGIIFSMDASILDLSLSELTDFTKISSPIPTLAVVKSVTELQQTSCTDWMTTMASHRKTLNIIFGFNKFFGPKDKKNNYHDYKFNTHLSK